MNLTRFHFKAFALILLMLIALAMMWALSRRNRNSASRINIDDLLLDPDGRMSKSAVVMFGSFGITGWIMVFLTLSDKMSEGYLTIFGGLWIAPAVTKLIKGPPQAPQPNVPNTVVTVNPPP